MLYQYRGVNHDAVLIKVMQEGLGDSSMQDHIDSMNKVYDVVADATVANTVLNQDELNILYQVFQPDFLTSADEGKRVLHGNIYDAIRYNLEENPNFQPLQLPAVNLDVIYPVPMQIYLRAYGMTDEDYVNLTTNVTEIQNFVAGWGDVTQPYLTSGKNDQYRAVLDGYVKTVPRHCKHLLAGFTSEMKKVADISEDLLLRVCNDLGGELHYFKRDGITELRILVLDKYRYIL